MLNYMVSILSVNELIIENTEHLETIGLFVFFILLITFFSNLLSKRR